MDTIPLVKDELGVRFVICLNAFLHNHNAYYEESPVDYCLGSSQSLLFILAVHDGHSHGLGHRSSKRFGICDDNEFQSFLRLTKKGYLTRLNLQEYERLIEEKTQLEPLANESGAENSERCVWEWELGEILDWEAEFTRWFEDNEVEIPSDL